MPNTVDIQAGALAADNARDIDEILRTSGDELVQDEILGRAGFDPDIIDLAPP